MKHLILPNDFQEFSSKFKQQKYEKKKIPDNNPNVFLNKSSSLGTLSLDKVEEQKNDDELKKKKLFQHYDSVKDQFEEKNYRKKPSHNIDTSESPIREMNDPTDEEWKEENKKKGTPRGNGIFFNVGNVKCDELDNFEKKNANNERSSEKNYDDEIIMEVKEELLLENSEKKGNHKYKFILLRFLLKSQRIWKKIGII